LYHCARYKQCKYSGGLLNAVLDILYFISDVKFIITIIVIIIIIIIIIKRINIQKVTLMK